MGCFKFILHLLGVLRHPMPRCLGPKPIALESSELGKLPPELILYISRFLPPESSLSFSLCCRPIYFTFGTQLSKTLAQNSYCFGFLTLLARDLPNHVPCYYCKKLHAIERAQQHTFFAHRHSKPWLPCWQANYELTIFHLHPNFSFTVFQMAIKRYRQGLDYSKLLNLLSWKETCYQDGYVKHHTALARIVNGSMLIREQKIFIVPLAQSRLTRETQYVVVCPHIFLLWNLESQGLHGVAERLLLLRRDLPKIDWNWRGLVRQCPNCLTDFCFDFKQFGDNAEAIFVTMWLDLGQDQSPLNYNWQSHVSRSADRVRLWSSVELDRSSVCTAFEKKEYFRFDSHSLLTQQGKKELFRLLRHR